MPLSQASLSSRLEAELDNILGSPQDSVQRKKVLDAIAKAVVDEITQNAVVTTTGTVTGGGSSGGQPTASTGTVA